MKCLFIFSVALAVVSGGLTHADEDFLKSIDAKKQALAEPSTNADDAGTAALHFINSYVATSQDWRKVGGVFAWLETGHLVTDHFRQALSKLYADALKKDPEIGYGADAVISGNDCPEHFTIKSATRTNDSALVVVIGPKNYPRELKIRMMKLGSQWLVDASGDLAR